MPFLITNWTWYQLFEASFSDINSEFDIYSATLLLTSQPLFEQLPHPWARKIQGNCLSSSYPGPPDPLNELSKSIGVFKVLRAVSQSTCKYGIDVLVVEVGETQPADVVISSSGSLTNPIYILHAWASSEDTRLDVFLSISSSSSVSCLSSLAALV